MLGARRSDPGSARADLPVRLDELERALLQFERRRAALGNDPRRCELAAALREFEEIRLRLQVLDHYGELWFLSGGDASALEYRNRVGPILAAAESRIQFFTNWWKSLSTEQADAHLRQPELTADHRKFLGDQRRLQRFALDERAEELLRRRDADGQDALLEIHALLTQGLRFTWDVGGKSERISRSALLQHTRGPDADLRQRAYHELFRPYVEQRAVLTQLYFHRCRGWWTEHVELRGHASPISARNAANELSDPAVAALLDAVREHAQSFAPYYRLKARWLGGSRLRRSDLYAPLGKSEKRVR